MGWLDWSCEHGRVLYVCGHVHAAAAELVQQIELPELTANKATSNMQCNLQVTNESMLSQSDTRGRESPQSMEEDGQVGNKGVANNLRISAKVKVNKGPEVKLQDATEARLREHRPSVGCHR